jgi:RHS repeat-associated protein
MTYDGLGRCVKIVETTAGSVTSTKQFVWSDNQRCEERDATGVLTRQFFASGEKIGATAYFFGKDHLSSIRQMTDSSAVVQAQYAYSPWGEVTKLQGSQDADFGYAGYYTHQRSGLNLTVARAYSASLGRFMSRDPIAEAGGMNLYGYCANSPIVYTDPLGLRYHTERDVLCPTNCQPPCDGTPVPMWCKERTAGDFDPIRGTNRLYVSVFFSVGPPGHERTYTKNDTSTGCYWLGPT